MKTFMISFALAFVCLSCSAQPTPKNLIPIDPARWYQLNTVTDTSLQRLFDGVINSRVIAGYGKVLTSYENWYALEKGEEIVIDSLRMYDGEGSFPEHPLVISVVTESWKRIPIAQFNGSRYNEWVGPNPADPQNLSVSTIHEKICFIVITSTNFNFPDEIQFFGKYQPPTTLAGVTMKKFPLSQMFGVNAFEWDFEAPENSTVIDEARMKAIQNFTAVRHYLDWEKLEVKQGSYTFNPTNMGGWNYDAIYERSKKDGIEILACIKTLPSWLLESYPIDMRDVENVPAKYGSDLLDPLSYKELAQVAFQFAARYGYNKSIDPALLSVNDKPRWTADPVNEIKIGLEYIRYIECENERDKWWKGRKGYQTGREYAASLSAFYDGHKNTMGPGIGVKNADPTMQVVMAGLADASIDYVKGMIDWCREFRGYKPDGSVNLCWDIINYHYYANDAQASQSGQPSRGAAPEVTTTARVASQFVALSKKLAGGMPVWMSETGYDLNQGSNLKAVAIGKRTAVETHADWTLRTALLYSRMGVERVFFFQLYDNNAENPTIFNSMGLINGDKTRRPAADFLYQTNRLMGQYTYAETINSDPIVDRYELNGKSVYMLVVPDEKGRTATYKLNLGQVANAKVYRPVIGQDSMQVEQVNVTSGQLDILVSETPLFVVPGDQIVTPVPEPKNPSKPKPVPGKKPTALNIYPNPAVDYFVLDIEDVVAENMQVNILSSSGLLVAQHTMKTLEGRMSKTISMKGLPFGMYYVEIIKGNERFLKKLVKTYQ